MSPAPSNPLLIAAQYRHADLIASLLAHRIEPEPSLAERSSEDGSILGYVLQIDRMAEQEAIPALITELLARGASPDSMEPDLRSISRYNYQTSRHELPRSHMAEIAARREEAIGSPIFEALGEERLKALSEELPLLHIAVAAKRLWAARALLCAGANPNRDHPGRGLAACEARDPDMLAVLLAHGATLSARDSRGVYPLEAIAGARCDPKLLELAVAASEAEARGERFDLGASGAPRRRSRQGEAPAALIDSLTQAIEQKQKDNVASLWATLGRKRALAARDSSGRTILHAAILSRQWAMAKRFLAAGLDPNAFDNEGHTPISRFIALPYQSDEKDRKGRQRQAMREALMPHVQWGAKDALGRGYAEALWGVSWEAKNGIYQSSHQESIWGSPCFDPVQRGADGLCFIERVLPQWREAKASFDYHTPAGSSRPLLPIVLQALDANAVDQRLCESLLEHFVGASSEILWSQYSYMTRDLSNSIGPLCKRLLDLGLARPDSFDPAPSLATASPDLHAAVEAWQLSALPEASSARRPSRSL